jgi:NitT/TauT family transport system ATP-binding protein
MSTQGAVSQVRRWRDVVRTRARVQVANSGVPHDTLRVRSVSKAFRGASGMVTALDDVSVDVTPGEFVCLVGPSGCGKSTLLNLIAGLEQPSQGQLMLGSRAIEGPGADRVVMFQEPALFPWLNVRDNVAFGLALAGLGKAERRERAEHYLQLVGLGSFGRAWVHELSGGMKGRAALARALVIDPQVLLMDEPFAALDAQTRDRMLVELQRIWMETKKTIIFVTHNVREAAVLGSRVLVFSARPGRIKAEIRIDALRPRELNNIELLAMSNRIAAELESEVAITEQQQLAMVEATALSSHHRLLRRH